MTVRLTIKEAIWRASIAEMVASCPQIVPVVKGNGYGFGRAWLAEFASEFSDIVAVGTLDELDAVPDSVTALVLTPSLRRPTRTNLVCTVSHQDHLTALDGWDGPVIIKMTSSMRRYGIDDPNSLDLGGRRCLGVSIHPPLPTEHRDNLDEVLELLRRVDPERTVWLSHLGADQRRELTELYPDRRFRFRIGTDLWHQARHALHLDAEVLDERSVEAGEHLGYREATAPSAGTVAMIGAGTANGVVPLADGRSPFHFRRQRLDLVEAPHMHTSMVFIADGEPCPSRGDWVDVQRPLTTTSVDSFRWL